jgi:DNA-directed RNA polymerase subunit N (RpoN/RPB10)
MEPPVCYECGKPISNLWDAFAIMKEQLKPKKTTQTQKSKLLVDPKYHKQLSEIFDQLQINRYCCRTHFTTIVQFKQL